MASRTLAPSGGSVLLLGIAALTLAPPQQPGRVLRGPAMVAPAGFARVSGVLELPNGRVLVVDPPGLTVFVADFSRSRVELVGRSGSGPQEYRLPERFLLLPGDSVGVWDAANSRFLIVGPTGAPAGFRDRTGRAIGTANPVGSIPIACAGPPTGPTTAKPATS